MFGAQLPRLYIANGSRYQARINCSFLVSPGNSASSTGYTAVEKFNAVHAEAGDVRHVVGEEGKKELVVNISIGDLLQLPTPVANIDIQLGSERQAIPREAIDDDGRDTSIIITEEGSIRYGSKDNSHSRNDDWRWVSKQNGTDHRPRKYFIANASGSAIQVTRTTNFFSSPCSEVINIENGKTATINYDRVTISACKDVYPPKPRTSIVVCSGLELKMTGQLYGNDIEEEKWKVDGVNYKPM